MGDVTSEIRDQGVATLAVRRPNGLHDVLNNIPRSKDGRVSLGDVSEV